MQNHHPAEAVSYAFTRLASQFYPHVFDMLSTLLGYQSACCVHHQPDGILHGIESVRCRRDQQVDAPAQNMGCNHLGKVDKKSPVVADQPTINSLISVAAKQQSRNNTTSL